MKSKKVLAQLAALSLLFGAFGTGSAWADEIIISGSDTTGTASGITLEKTDDGFKVSDQDVKGVWLKEKAKLTANNVNFINGGKGSWEVGLDSGSTLIMNGGRIDTEMRTFAADGGSTAEINNAKVTTGAWANNSTITLKGCTTTGDVLYAGNEWGEGNVAAGLPEGRLTIDGGTATVGNLLVQNKAVFTVTNKATLDLTGDTSALSDEEKEATGITNKGNITVRAWGPNTSTSEKGNNEYVQKLDQAAQLRVDGGSTVKADTIDLYGYGHREQDPNVYRGKMVVLGNSSVTAKTMNIGNYGYASFTDSQLTVNGKLSITGIGYDDKYDKPYGLDINGGSATLNAVSVTKYGKLGFTNGVKATLGEVTASGEGSTISMTAEATSTPDVTISKLVLKDKAAVDLSAGKLTANSIDAGEDTKIEIKGTGLLSTKSDQVYTTSAANNAKDSGDVKSKAFVFTAGTLELTDATYTKDYMNAALAALSKHTSESKTSLIMSGKQVDESGEEIKSNTIDEMKNKSDGVILDQTTVTSDKNFLIGTEADLGNNKTVGEVKVEKQVANGFGAKDLTLTKGEGNVGVVITNEKTLTLGGKSSGELISVVDGKGTAVSEAVKVVVGTTAEVASGVKTAGTFTIGNAAVDTATKYKLNGEVLVNKDSALNVNGQATISDGVTLAGGSAAVKEGAKLIVEKKLAVTDSAAISGAAEAATVEITNGKVLSIGNNDKAGRLEVKEIKGGMVFLDPAWSNGKEITEASGLAFKGADAADRVTITTALAVGHNSRISVGSELSSADDAFAKTGLTWGKDVTAAAYIGKAAILSSDTTTPGSLTVDGILTQENKPTQTPDAGTLKLADKSMLMVDGAAVTGDNAALSGVKSTTIDAGSKLYIDNAKMGETYKILAGEGLSAQWDVKNVLSSNALLAFTADTDIVAPTENAMVANDTQNTYLNYKSSVQSVKKVYGNEVIAPDVIDKAADGKGALSDFIMDKAVQSGVNSTKAAQVSALNSAVELSELAGAARGAYTTAGLVNDAVADHMSIVHEYTHDKDVWAKYIHNKEDIDDLSIAGKGASYKNKYNGIVVGADLYHNDKATVGVALTYGDGDITGSTLSAYTKNDAKYYGATIYGGIHKGDTAFLGDISYLHSKNDITQTNSTETITGSEKSNAFSIGLRAEQSVKAGDGQFVPYVGLRYMRLSNDGYTDSLGMNHDGGDLNLWLLPIGVKYSMDAKHGSWTLRPIAEIGYVWNMGDRDAIETVSFDGTSNSFGYDVTDNGSYLGHLGFEAEKGNTTFGIGYQYQKGDSTKSNRWSASVNYRF